MTIVLRSEASRKTKGGFTLLEAVIALGLWVILMGGIFLLWHHSAASSVRMLQQQSAFENARIAMDALKMNFQLARRFELTTNADGVLESLVLNQIPPTSSGSWHDFRFDFDITRSPDSVRYQRLEFGGNEFASGLAEIRIVYAGERVEITVITGCDPPIILHGSVCVRFKEATVNGVHK